MTGRDVWDGHMKQLSEFLAQVQASQTWMNGAKFPEAFKNEMMFPPKIVPPEVFAIVPQGSMGYGVCSLSPIHTLEFHSLKPPTGSDCLPDPQQPACGVLWG